MDWCSESSTKVGWAWGDVTKVVISGEVGNFTDGSAGSGESTEDLGDTSTLLHGDDSELILFVNPDEESLLVIVENTSSWWPISVEIASLKESISLPIIKNLLNNLLI